LLDEVDKAHPDVLTVLLQLFDEVNKSIFVILVNIYYGNAPVDTRAA
jgi:AAA domain (Cdc48 subfamily)